MPDNVNAQADATPGEGGATEPEYITKAQLKEFGESLKGDLSSWYKGVQSQTDRVREGLANLGKSLDLLKSQGVELTPEQVKNIENQVKLDAIAMEPQEPGQQAQQPAPQTGDDEELNPVTLAAISLMEEIGAVVEEDDPEADILAEASNKTIKEYYAAARKAAQAKKERLARDSKDTTARTNANLTGTRSSNPIESVMDLDDLWTRAEEKGQI